MWEWLELEVDSLSDGYKRKMGGAQVNLDSFQGTRAYWNSNQKPRVPHIFNQKLGMRKEEISRFPICIIVWVQTRWTHHVWEGRKSQRERQDNDGFKAWSKSLFDVEASASIYRFNSDVCSIRNFSRLGCKNKIKKLQILFTICCLQVLFYFFLCRCRLI